MTALSKITANTKTKSVLMLTPKIIIQAQNQLIKTDSVIIKQKDRSLKQERHKRRNIVEDHRALDDFLIKIERK